MYNIIVVFNILGLIMKFIQEMEKNVLEEGFFLEKASLKGFPRECHYQGRNYSLSGVYARKLKEKERFLTFLESLGKTLLSFGFLLATENLREKWKSVFTGKKILVIYCLSENHPRINLRNFLSKLPVEEGVDLTDCDERDRKMFGAFVEIWKNLESRKQEWTVSEFSKIFGIEEKEVSELFYRLQIFKNASSLFHCDVVNWLFQSIEDVLENRFRGRMIPTPMTIWSGNVKRKAQENRYPEGFHREYWDLEALSMFLAVEKEGLKKFLLSKKVVLNSEGNYRSKDIDDVFKNFVNGKEREGLKRIQKNSLRFTCDRAYS